MKYAEKGRKFSQVSVRYSDDAGGSRLLERGEGICIVTAAAWNLLLPVTWNTIKKRFHVAKALPVLLPVLLLVSACALTPVTYSSKETQKASAESVSVSVTAAPTKKRRRPRLKHQHQRRQQHRPKHQRRPLPRLRLLPQLQRLLQPERRP